MFSITKRIYIFTTLLVLFTTTVMISLNLYDHWKTMVESEFDKTESITLLLDLYLEGTYDQYIDTTASEEEKILILNEKLQPFINKINQAYPSYGAGYYSKDLNSIVAFGPNFNEKGLKDISPESKARNVYKTLKPYKFRDFSQTRGAQVIAIIHPIIRNGEIIGHVWGNIELVDVSNYFQSMVIERVLFLILIIVIALVGTRFITHQYTKSLQIFKDRVQQLDIKGEDAPTFLPELMDIYNEVVRTRHLIADRESEVQRLIKKKMIQAQDDERKRVSRDLHDSVGQSLYAIFMSLKIANQLEDEQLKAHLRNIEKMTDEAMKETKRISFQLRPSALDDLGLIPAMKSYIQVFQENFGIDVDFQLNGKANRYDSTIETFLYRIFQEALNNTAKYAEAKKVDVSLNLTNELLEMIIVDEGNGFNVEKILNEHKGLGLFNMKERAEFVNGQCHIHSAEGKGTTVHVTIPLTL